MHITPELEAELNAESTDKNKVREQLIKAMKTKNIDGESVAQIIYHHATQLI